MSESERVVVEEIFAPVPFVERGTAYVLAGEPKGKGKILYTCGKLVIIRDIADPKKCDVYSDHARKVTAAQYAPSGNYICSGDDIGNIRIWDSLSEDHKCKTELRPFSGRIQDIAWGPEGKRMAICGEAKVTQAVVIMTDTGNSLGKLGLVTKRGNSISYKSTRPYRIAAGDDSYVVSIYEGPPFKSKLELHDHKRFVNSVRYSPNGEYLASGSLDGHVFLYNAKTSEKVGHFGCEIAHGGGVNAISWSPDSKELLTTSGDKSAKIWNVETREEVAHFILGKETADQQYSCLWAGDYLITLSLSGKIKYLDRSNPEKPLRVICGHSKPITKIIVLDEGCHVTGDYSGKMLKWDTKSGEAQEFIGAGHTNKIVGLAYDPESKEIISTGWDDKIRYTSAATCDFSTATTISLDSQPSFLALAGDGFVVVNCINAIVLFKDKKKVFEIPHDEEFTPTGLAAHGHTVAIEKQGGGVKIFNLESNTLVDTGVEINLSCGAQVMSFSSDGSMLAVGLGIHSIRIFTVCNGYALHKELLGHHLRPSALAWSPDGETLASASIDCSLIVWKVTKKGKEEVEKAHNKALIFGMAWQTNHTLFTVGDDWLTKLWRVTM